MLTMPLPILPALNLRPTVAQWNNFLVIASDDQLIRSMIAVQKGAPGFKSTPEYAALSAGLPEQGNRFGLTTLRFSQTLQKIQNQMYGIAPILISRCLPQSGTGFPRIRSPVIGMGVAVHLPNGVLTVSQIKFAAH